MHELNFLVMQVGENIYALILTFLTNIYKRIRLSLSLSLSLFLSLSQTYTCIIY